MLDRFRPVHAIAGAAAVALVLLLLASHTSSAYSRTLQSFPNALKSQICDGTHNTLAASQRVNAAIVVLARNSDRALPSIC
jgi:hypothetical protein